MDNTSSIRLAKFLEEKNEKYLISKKKLLHFSTYEILMIGKWS